MYYFGARWYDPELGRWLSPEPLGLDGPNLYHFNFNDPIDYVDLTGNYAVIDDVIALSISGAMGAGTNALSYYVDG